MAESLHIFEFACHYVKLNAPTRALLSVSVCVCLSALASYKNGCGALKLPLRTYRPLKRLLQATRCSI